MSDESYPDELYYHDEHDWVRVDGDTATFGITWYAQDTLGEVVFYSPPEVGDAVTRTPTTASSSRRRRCPGSSHPSRARCTAVNDALDGNESTVNDDPYGEGWLIKVRMSDPSELDSLLDAAAYRELARVPVTFTALTDADRDAMLAAVGVGSIEELFHDIPDAVRLGRELDLEPALTEGELMAHLADLASRNADAGREIQFLGAGIYDHYVPAVCDAVMQRGELLTAYTPYQPEMSQGTLQAIFEYQTAICELTGMDVSNASGYDGSTVAADACYVARGATRRSKVVDRRDAEPAGAARRARRSRRDSGWRSSRCRTTVARPTPTRCGRRPRTPRA